MLLPTTGAELLVVSEQDTCGAKTVRQLTLVDADPVLLAPSVATTE